MRKSVDDLISVMDIVGTLERSLQSMQPVLKVQMTSQLLPFAQKDAPHVKEAEIERVLGDFIGTTLQQGFVSYSPTLSKLVIDAMHDIYPRYLTVDELEHIANVYREDRVMRKIARTMPDVMRDLTTQLSGIQGDVQKRITKIMETELPNLVDGLRKLEADAESKAADKPPRKP